MASPQWWDEARALHAIGMSRRELALRFNRSENMIGKVLRPDGLTKQTESPVSALSRPRRRKPAPPPSQASIAEITRLHARGMRRTFIAAKLKIRYADISLALGDPPYQPPIGPMTGRRGIPSDRLAALGVR